MGAEHSTSRATINEILSQMDGFKQTDNVLVIGATNNYEVLDPAAIRPGRFDHKIYIPLPDMKGREEILELYLSKIIHDFSKLLAKRRHRRQKTCPDDSRLQRRRVKESRQPFHNPRGEEDEVRDELRSRKHATMEDFDFARDQIIMGIERRNLKIDFKERMATAIHEVGHTLAAYYTDGPEHIYKVTINPRGGSLGAVTVPFT